MKTGKLFLLCTVILASPSWAQVSIGTYETSSFKVGGDEVFPIPVEVRKAGRVTLWITTPDRDRLRKLGEKKASRNETLVFHWDGEDESGQLVPDEAYVPLVIWKGEDEQKVVYDPAAVSGGEMLDKLTPDLSRKKQVSFQIETPSRILIRAGLKGGPLMKSLLNWEPRPAGKNLVAWDGHDADKLINLRYKSNLGVMITGYRLPDHSIITQGNASDYFSWREKKGWQSEVPDFSQLTLARGNQRLSRHFHMPLLLNREPELLVSLPGNEISPSGTYRVSEPFNIRVDLGEGSEWSLVQSQYEIAFFIDGEFYAEEEQGYVPLNWRFDPGQLEPGEHLLTVNLSGFYGAVGVKSLKLVKD